MFIDTPGRRAWFGTVTTSGHGSDQYREGRNPSGSSVVPGAVRTPTRRPDIALRSLSGWRPEALLEHLPDGERRDRHATAAAALDANQPQWDDAEARQVGAIAYHHDRAENTQEAIE